MNSEISKDTDVFYSVSAGPVQGNGVARYYSEIVIHGGFAAIDFFWNRAGADRAGVPVGWFSMPMEPDDAAGIREAIASLSDPFDRGPERGYAGQPRFRLMVQTAKPGLDLKFVQSDALVMSATEKLRDLLNAQLFNLLRRPVAELKAELTQSGDRLVLSLRNDGIEPVCIADPRAGQQDGSDRAAFFRTAKRHAPVPGMGSPPLQWSHLNLDGRDAAEPTTLLEIPARESMSFSSIPWQPEQSDAGHIAQGVFIDYFGAENEDCFSFRGGVFSNNLLLPSG